MKRKGKGGKERGKEKRKRRKNEKRERKRSRIKRKERIVMAESEKGLKRMEKKREREKEKWNARVSVWEKVKKSENRAKRWNKSIVPNYYRETAWSWVYTRLQTSARNSRRYITFIIQHWPTLVIVPSILFSLSARGYFFTSLEYRINRFSALNRDP